MEVHNLRATNAPDLASFKNDMEFHITTISSMSCSHLRGLGTIVTGKPGFIDYRVSPLSSFANYSCLNTTRGPTIILKCNDCKLLQDSAYISWQFVDLPSDPATAVGFLFNITASNRADNKHVSSVNGTVKNGSNQDNREITFRGAQPNILRFNLFPRLYHNLHDLNLIQPLFLEFLQGSTFSDSSQLQASLQNSNNGLINTTLHVNFLTAYIVEIDSQNILGPVSFLADLGGLYCISIGIFFYLMVQCEYRIKKLRHEDDVMRNIRNRQKAQVHWDKLRKYVMYTWGSNLLNDKYNKVRNEPCCSGFTVQLSLTSRSTQKRKQQRGIEAISFSRNASVPSEQKGIPEGTFARVSKHCLTEPSLDQENRSNMLLGQTDQELRVPENPKNGTTEPITGSNLRMYTGTKDPLADDATLLPPPSLGSCLAECNAPDEVTIAELQKKFQKLEEENSILRKKLVAAQSMLHALDKKK